MVRVHIETNLKSILRENGIKPGLYQGKELKDIANKFYKYLQFELESKINKYNKELIFYIYAQIEYFLIENRNIKFNFAKALPTNPDIVNYRIELSESVIRKENAFRHLLETTLKICPKGKKEITTSDSFDLDALSSSCFTIASISDNINYGLNDYSLKINEDYSYNLSNIEKQIDSEDHWNEYNKRALDLDKEYMEIYSKISTDPNYDPFKLPPFYLNLDEAFKIDFGFTFIEFINVLRTMANFNPPDMLRDDFDPLMYIDEESLVKEIKRAYHSMNIKIQSSVIKDILNFISIDPELFRESEPFLPTDLKMKKNRFTVRPLIKFREKNETFYLYGSESVHFTADLYNMRIQQGRFPYSIIENENVWDVIKSININIGNRLEKQLDEKLSEIFGREYVVSKLDNFRTIDGISSRKEFKCGEIDSLAIDKENKIIHVLEAKYIKTGLVPIEMKGEIKKFSPKGKDYTNKLLNKCEFVSNNIKRFLECFKIFDSEGWQVKSAFVTYDVQISAFLTNNKTKFISLSQLEEYLKSFGKKRRAASTSAN